MQSHVAAILAGYRAYVQADAQAFGATMVDLDPLFSGNELTLTHIGSGENISPQSLSTLIFFVPDSHWCNRPTRTCRLVV